MRDGDVELGVVHQGASDGGGGASKLLGQLDFVAEEELNVLGHARAVLRRLLVQLDEPLLPLRTRLPVLASLAAIADGNARTQAKIVKHDGLVHIVHAAVSAEEALQNRAVLALLAFHNAVRSVPRCSHSINAQFTAACWP